MIKTRSTAVELRTGNPVEDIYTGVHCVKLVFAEYNITYGRLTCSLKVSKNRKPIRNTVQMQFVCVRSKSARLLSTDEIQTIIQAIERRLKKCVLDVDVQFTKENYTVHISLIPRS